MPKTYAEAGVDIDKESLAIRAIASQIERTHLMRKGKVGQSLSSIGYFSGIVRLNGEKALAISTDGVGTKILVAKALERYDTIGIDLVAMNANDVICVGAEPITMVDYLAMSEPDERVTKEIGKGLAKGAEEAGISIIGGELATVPEIVNGLDLAGTIVGIVELSNIITGEDISPGDVVIGLESSGIHTNGLTLARKVLLEEYDIGERVFGRRSVGEELLIPTKIYVNEVLDMLKDIHVRGLANITGGGLVNLSRLTKYGFLIDSVPEPQEVFKIIQEVGGIGEDEMYRTFNMGIGFCVVAGKDDAKKVIDIASKHHTKSFEIGRVVEEAGVKIKGEDLTKH